MNLEMSDVWMSDLLAEIKNIVQSFLSKIKMVSTGLPKTFAIFKANIVEGTYLPASIELMVCLETPILLARSSCVIFFIARSTRRLFFILQQTFLTIKNPMETNNENDENRKHIINHYR